MHIRLAAPGPKRNFCTRHLGYAGDNRVSATRIGHTSSSPVPKIIIVAPDFGDTYGTQQVGFTEAQKYFIDKTLLKLRNRG